MSLYAIADTHLSLSVNKPMDKFDGWFDYVNRLENNWNHLVEPNDSVIIVGDISWAMNFEELKKDFEFLNNLNGNIIISKGNHDFWWNTITKMNKFVEDNSFSSISFLYNSSKDFDNFSICASRGWMLDNETEHDVKILNREVKRLEMSINCANNKEKIVFLHYPPITDAGICIPIIELLKKYEIKKCFYGHLHGYASRNAYEGEYEGITFKCISADRLNFTPIIINKF